MITVPGMQFCSISSIVRRLVPYLIFEVDPLLHLYSTEAISFQFNAY